MLLIRSEIEKVNADFNQLSVDYENCDVDKALSDSSPATFDIIQYLHELMSLYDDMLEAQSKLIKNLSRRLNFNQEIDVVQNLLLEVTHKLEINICKYAARKEQKKEQASKGGFARALNDPKHKAIKAIEMEFSSSSYQFNTRGYKAKFAREMLEKYPVITDIKSINRLVAKLSKDRA